MRTYKEIKISKLEYSLNFIRMRNRYDPRFREFQSKFLSSHDLDFFDLMGGEVALIKNIRVHDEEERGRGLGSRLLTNLCRQFEDVDAIFLAADVFESGSWLVDWYERHGFHVIQWDDGYPVMCRPSEALKMSLEFQEAMESGPELRA